MKKLSVFIGLTICSIWPVLSPAAPGEVTVTLEKSTDQASWSPASVGVLDVTTPQYLRAMIVPTDGGTPSTSEVTLADTIQPAKTVNVSLESSTELSSWTTDSPGVHDVSGGKKFFRVRSETDFNHFVEVVGDHSLDPYSVSLYEVTKEEWDKVYAWAIENGYTFFESDPGNPQNYGLGCNLNHPVNKVSWYDAIKWCNAKSEMEGLTPFYYTDSTLATVYRQGQLNLTVTETLPISTAYRLPTENEWVVAANEGNTALIYTYSGSNTPGDVAIYEPTSDNAECGTGPQLEGTWPVASKLPNSLGIYDMSGNVQEWTFTGASNQRFIVGGGFDQSEPYIRITTNTAITADSTNKNLGFRLARTVLVIPTLKAGPAKAHGKSLKTK